jgi:hypothetical protein
MSASILLKRQIVTLLHSETTLRVAPTTVDTARNVVFLFYPKCLRLLYVFYVEEIRPPQKIMSKSDDDELFKTS